VIIELRDTGAIHRLWKRELGGSLVDDLLEAVASIGAMAEELHTLLRALCDAMLYVVPATPIRARPSPGC
jgi:hypothetical protein